MTKAQATAMNERFVSLTDANKDLELRLKSADSMAFAEKRIAMENLIGFGYALDSIKLLKSQFHISQGALFVQTDRVKSLEAQLKKKPPFREMSSTDVWMGSVFVMFATILTSYSLLK
jgi:hypothetical protein